MTDRQRKARGSIEARGGKWFLRIPSPERRRRRIELGLASDLRSEAAARRAADAWLARNRPWELQAGDSVSFAEFAEQYLRLAVRRLRTSSQKRYRSTIRTHLVPALGSMPLAQLTEQRVQELLLALGRGHRRSTVMGIRSVLLQILRRARAEGLDVADLDQKLMLPPRDNTPAPERAHINADQLHRILQGAEQPWRALWAVMGYAGLRCGEALALTWEHVDLRGKAIRVRQSVSLGTIAPTKTRLSAADVPIVPPLLDQLSEYFDAWPPNAAGLLWAGRRGRPLSADKVRERRWQPLLARVGLPRCGLHALRHGAASRLFQLGCDARTVQLVMRHRSLEMTERYSHASFQQLLNSVSAAYSRNRNAHS